MYNETQSSFPVAGCQFLRFIMLNVKDCDYLLCGLCVTGINSPYKGHQSLSLLKIGVSEHTTLDILSSHVCPQNKCLV